MALVPLIELKALLGLDQWVMLSLDGLGDVPRPRAVAAMES